jgi:tetratricopeptide (TPR) repeat protein
MRQTLTQFIQRRGIADSGSPNLDLYLSETHWLSLPAVERLRVLAHVMEQKVQARPPEEQFATLRPVFVRALTESPHDPWLWHAWGERAAALAVRVEARGPRRWMWREAQQSFERAMRLAPGHADLAFAYAKSLYDDAELGARLALEWFEQVLAFSPTHRSARLFLGHCLQQLGRWEEAAEAYETLLRDSGVGLTMLSVRANWAHCLQQLGRGQQADAAYSEILALLDQLPPERCEEALTSLEDGAAFPPQLVERWEGMVARAWTSAVV